MEFEVYDDAGGGARLRLIASNGEPVASSGEAFASRPNAQRAAKAFAENASKSTSEVSEDQGGKHRWRAKSSNGQVVASSGEAYASKSNAQRAADTVQAGAAKAECTIAS